MTIKSSNYNTRSRVVVLLVFFVHGSLIATWVSRIPAIQSKLDLSEGELGLVLLGMSVGVLVALSFSGGLNVKFGSKFMTLSAAIMICITLPFLALAGNEISLWLVLFFLGAGLSLMDVAMNEQAILVERNSGRPMMSSFHAAFSIGGLFGALIGSGMAAFLSMVPLLHFSIISLTMGCMMLYLFPKLLVYKSAKSEDHAIFLMPERALWALGAIAFSSSIGEGAMADWSAVYLTKVLKTDASFAALGFAAFSLTMTLGRIFGDKWSTIWKPELIVKVGGIISSLGFLLVVFTSEPLIVLLGFAIVGIGLANIIPLAFSAAGNHKEIPTGTGIASVAAIGYAGFLAGPPVIGLIAEWTSLRASIFLVALLCVTLVFTSKAVSNEK